MRDSLKSQHVESGQIGISVVICCFNSGWVLKRTLEAIAVQKVDDCVPWEIIVVDNNSTDNTQSTILDFKRSNPHLDANIVIEKAQGLSHARIAGYKQAKYNIIIYCDDDNILAADYLQIAIDFMLANPHVGQCGGIGEPIFEGDPDPRILPFIDIYATGPQGSTGICDITDRGFANGAGMVTRKSVLDHIFKCGFEYTSTGRSGKTLSGGEDVELGYAIKVAGYSIYYNENLKYQHVLAKHRLNWEYLKKMVYGSGNSNVFFHPDTIYTIQSHPLYILLHYYFRTIKRIPRIFLGSPTPAEQLKFSYFCGTLRGINREFWNVFNLRKKARIMYKSLNDSRDDHKGSLVS